MPDTRPKVYRLEITSEEQYALLSLLEWFSENYGRIGKSEIWQIEGKLRKSVVCLGLKPATIDYNKLRK